jgi:hypothetical protein
MGIAFLNTFVIATAMIALVQSLKAVPQQLTAITIRRLPCLPRRSCHKRAGQTFP